MHGIRSSRAAMLGRVELVNQLNLSALAFDLQAHGESEGSQITFGHLESYDARAAVSFVRLRSPELPIYVIGVSLGGAAAILSDPPLEVDGMILEAVYPNIPKAIANRLALRIPFGEVATPLLTMQIQPRLGISADNLSPQKSAARITTPVLVLGGSRDLHTTPEDTRALFDAFAGEKHLEIFPGAAHVNLQRFDQKHYDSILTTFIEERLADDS